MKLKTVVVLILLIILGIFAYMGIKDNNKSMDLLIKNDIEDINTELLQVQAKVKIINEQSVIKNDENLLKGEKLQDSQQEHIINVTNQLTEKEIIKQDEENFKKYYLWDKDLLSELDLSLSLEENSYVVVNYETFEVILTSGFKVSKDGETLYKLSEIE